ncbi:MAG: 2-amino-4-hydroxy-6-hydroxymethyldihydropteridine diphosphokinase [Candidatus Sulfotelmatobacter sp.]
MESSAIKLETTAGYSMAMPNFVYLSLGSNVGDREAQLRDAQARLGVLGRIVAVSSVYETEPVEFTEQPWFLNCAIALETSLAPQQLMSAILSAEQQMGRVRGQSKGPRSIDIDILLFGNEIIESPDLTIPHPAMYQRRFVLEPMAEIAPEVVHPILEKTIRELLDSLPPGQGVRKLKHEPRI